MKKIKNKALIGFLQALAVFMYVLLVSALMWLLLDKDFGMFWGPVLVLMLFVISAAICGALVFGYPIKLALDKKISKALIIVAYTLLFSSVFWLIIALIMNYV